MVEVRVKTIREKVELTTDWQDCIEVDIRLDGEVLGAEEMARQFRIVKREWQMICPN